MSDLVPCPTCRRHVRKHESACPFCAAGLTLAHLPPPVLPRIRLGRAATFAFGATLVGASLVGCGGDAEEGKKGGAGGNAGGSAGGSAGQAGSSLGGNAMGGNAMGGNIAQPYGVPPIGGAGFGNFGGAGGQTSAGAGGQASAGAGGQTSAAGSGGQGESGSGQVPPYGTPPAEGGGTPVYGAAPAD
jgi:hypothetical protein